jgi:hypothetical protein
MESVPLDLATPLWMSWTMFLVPLGTISTFLAPLVEVRVLVSLGIASVDVRASSERLLTDCSQRSCKDRRR